MAMSPRTPPAAIRPLANSEPGLTSLSAWPPLGLPAALGRPADDAAAEDRQRRVEPEVGADRERQRADAEQLHRDDEEDAHRDQAPGQALVEDAGDHRRHQAPLRRRGLVAADAGDPLHLDLPRVGVVEILAVGQLARAERVDQDVLLVLVDLRMRIVELLLDAHGRAAVALLRADLLEVDRPAAPAGTRTARSSSASACRR